MVLTLYKIMANRQDRLFFIFIMHLIPRYEGDQVGITWKPGTLTDEVKMKSWRIESC